MELPAQENRSCRGCLITRIVTLVTVTGLLGIAAGNAAAHALETIPEFRAGLGDNPALVVASAHARDAASPLARAHAFSRQDLPSLPSAAQGPVSEALGAESPAYRISRTPASLINAATPAQRLHSSFTSAGVSVNSGGARVTLSLRAAGYGSTLTPVGRVVPRAHANRVVYQHPGLSEWYANGPLGVEQGFTIPRPLSRRASGPLTLSFVMAGNAHPVLAADGRSIAFSRNGQTVLRYTGLSANDATGQALRSWLALESGRVVIRIDSQGARYPVRIDPFIQEGAKLTVNEDFYGEGLFGATVALSPDGSTALIGAPGHNVVRVFTHTGSTWSEQGPGLTPSEEVGGDVGTVALSSDGNTALVGSPYDNDTGAVWVFTRTGSTWTQQGPKLTGSDETPEALFGASVALSSDGNTALIGSPGEPSNPGAVWVFTRTGSTWTQQGPKLTGSEEAEGARFGGSVALSSDGNTALIGADGNSYSIGGAWVFTRTGSTWTQQGPKLTGEGENQSGFGVSVALSSDGSTALVGGQNDGYDNGAAWVFTRAGSTWTEQGPKLTGTEEIGQSAFGHSVALASNGSTALIGGPSDNGGTGAVWVFNGTGSAWTQQGPKLTGSEESGAGQFGSSVALSADGNTALIGAPLDNNGKGAVWVFTSGESAVPSNVSPPTISGSVLQGETLTVTNGTWTNSPTNYSHQWERCDSTGNGCQSIVGATGDSYTPTASDVGHRIRVEEKASNAAGPGAPANSAATEVVQGGGGGGPCSANGATPTICSVTPVAGPLEGGTHITVTGVGFLPGDQLCFYIALDVNAGECASQETVVSPTKIDAVTPSEDYPTGGIGVYYLGVQRCCSGLQTSIYHSNVNFTFFPPPPPPPPTPGGCDVFSIGPTACWRVGAGATADWFTSEISSSFGPARNPDFIVASLTGGASYSRGPSGAFSAIITCSGDIFVEPSIGYSFVGGGIPLGTPSLKVLNIGAVLAAGYVGTPGNPQGTYSWRQVDGFVQGATADVSVGFGGGMAFMVSPTAPGPKTGIEYWQGTVGQIAVSGGLGFWLAGPDPHADSNQPCGDILNTTTWRTLTSRGSAVGLAARKSVAIYLGCPASNTCTGTAALTGTTRLAAIAARARHGNGHAGVLGITQFAIQPYRSRWVIIPLGKSAQRRLVASRGRLTAMLALDESIAGHPLHSSEPVALQRPPNLSRVAQKARKWREPGRRVHRVPAGTVFSFTLNQPAHVTMTFLERSQSHRVNAGQLSITGRAGTNRVRFRGAIVPKLWLAPGTYRVIITATNAAGQRSKPHHLTFRILR